MEAVPLDFVTGSSQANPSSVYEQHNGSVRNFSRPFVGPPAQNPDESSADITSSNAAPSQGDSLTDGAAEHGLNSEEYRGVDAPVSRVPTESTVTTPQPRAGFLRRAAAGIGIDRFRLRGSISLTPSELPGMAPSQPASYSQLEEIRRVIKPGRGYRFPITSMDQGNGDYVSEPPNGGLSAWSHVAAGFFISMNTHGLNMSYGVFQRYYEKEMFPGTKPAKIVWIGTFQVFAMCTLFLLVGPLVNKGYFRTCFNYGSLALFLGLFSVSFCQDLWQLILVQGLLVGTAMGFVFCSSIMVLMTYFSSRLGIATVLATAGSSVGGVIFSMAAHHSIEQFGFPWGIRAISLINLITMVPVNIVFRERCGWRCPPSRSADWLISGDLPYAMMMSGMFLIFWGLYFGFYFMISFSQDVMHLGASTSLDLIVTMNAANLLARIILSLVSQLCIGPVNTLVATALSSALLVFLWIHVASPRSLLLIACLYGFVAAGAQCLATATIFALTRNDHSTGGPKVALVFAAMGVAVLTGGPLAAQLIVMGGGKYLYAQIFSGASIAVGGLFVFGARLAKRSRMGGRL
ncbi:hypothetical protein FQN53_003267 [Emmonsiellopsis sp. PD_33]|nr:hypothetical protein FQN53_003267 [Emmonsiellopsis sp. PD_33]